MKYIIYFNYRLFIIVFNTNNEKLVMILPLLFYGEYFEFILIIILFLNQKSMKRRLNNCLFIF